VNKYRGPPPNATVGNNIDDPLTDELFGNSRLGGSRRKTRRARKYRNRT
jgi:hypothetical protein